MKADKKKNRPLAPDCAGESSPIPLPAMKASLRDSGSKVLGMLPWGTHLCQFYESKQDILDILVPYFAAGLKNNEFCLWMTSAPLSPMEAERALAKAVPGLAELKRRGQIEILRYAKWSTKAGPFDINNALKNCLEKESWAMANGYAGLRAAGNPSWMGENDRNFFMDYERLADSVIGKHRILAICAYSVKECPLSDLLELIIPHEFALVKNHGTWHKVAGGRRKMEAALCSCETKYKALFNTSADGILIADLETKKLSYANPAACRMFGYTEKEMLTLGVENIHPLINLPSVITTFEAQVRGKTSVVSLPCLRKNGEIFYADINPARIVIDDRVCNLGIFRDITERLKAEEALKNTCSDLVAGKKLLEEKNIALREVLSTVELEKNKMKDEIAANLNEIILPILTRVKLKNGNSCKHLDLLEKSLGALVSSFGLKLTKKNVKLTPKEIEISNMIKLGLTTKEISGLMNASSLTISKHRNNIRKKFDLANKGVNLLSFLKSL